MKERNSSNYKLVYGHLWQTFGKEPLVRISYVMQFFARLSKLVALPIAISLIITRISEQDYTGARDAVLIFVVFSLLLGILTPAIKYIGMIGENRAYHQVTMKYFDKLVNTDINYFNTNLSGYLTTATRQYIDSSMLLVRGFRDKYMGTILSILLPLVVITWFDPVLGFITFILSSIQAAYLLWASKKLNKYRSRSRELYKRNNGLVADIITNILAVKSSAKEKIFVSQVKNGSIEEGKLYQLRYTVQSKLIAMREFITVIFFMILLWLTVDRMESGSITITVAVLVVTYTTTILAGIYALSENLDEHDDLVDKMLPAFDVLNRKNSVDNIESPKTFNDIKGSVVFKNVSFKYEKNSSLVFEEFDLTIPAGQKIGVVGLSGAGKSTLTKLLLRFNDVENGSISIDNIDIKTVNQQDLRDKIAYVPQEPLLFHTSIKDNVLLKQTGKSKSDVIGALKKAHAYEFVEKLPDGINSIVGERGIKLSAGQKQRVAIARAVLQNAPIIILDEATSALDSESEQIIKDSFIDILKGRTAIVVAHRLSTLSEMDRIVVIHHGKILEDGTHEQLYKQKGAYYKLWQKQQHN